MALSEVRGNVVYTSSKVIFGARRQLGQQNAYPKSMVKSKVLTLSSRTDMKKAGCGEYPWKLNTGEEEKVRGSLASQLNLMSKHQDRKRTALRKEDEWHVMNDTQS